MATAQISSIRLESQTWDEAFNLAAGLSYWKTGDFRMNTEHPPLGKYINALPLLFLDLKLPTDHPSWRARQTVPFGREFLYHNRLPAEMILFRARLMTILLTIALGLALAVWVRKRFGPAPALGALLLFAFDPNLIAHGRYVTSDMPMTCFAFLACTQWGEYLLDGRRRNLWFAALSFAAALLSKFSAVFILAVFLLLWIARRPGWRHFLQSFGAVALATYLAILIAYAPEAPALVPGVRLVQPWRRPVYDVVDERPLAGKLIRWSATRLGLAANSFFEGFSMIAVHNLEGHEAYLLGEPQTGWWYYFPVVFAVKTPTGVLLGLLAALALGFRKLTFPCWVAAVPALFYFGLSLTTAIDIGVRHLLPIYPFLYALLGAILWNTRRWLIAPAAALVIAEAAAIHPHYLAFFNTLAGGPANGPRYLLDSNLDWGQDARKVAVYLKQHGIRSVCIIYFGTADLSYYGIDHRYLPRTDQLREIGEMQCDAAAASVTPLYGLYVPPKELAWLRQKQPIAKIGYSIYLYDVRRNSVSTPSTK